MFTTLLALLLMVFLAQVVLGKGGTRQIPPGSEGRLGEEVLRLREEVERLAGEVSRLEEEQRFMLGLLGSGERTSLPNTTERAEPPSAGGDPSA